MDSLASKISHKTLDRIVEDFRLAEVHGESGGPFLELLAPAFGNARAGEFRLFHGGEKLSKVVYTGIAVDHKFMVGHGHIDQHPIALSGVIHFEYMKNFLCALIVIDLGGRLQVHTDLPGGIQLRFEDGKNDLLLLFCG